MRQYIAGGTEFNTREKHVGAPLLKRVFTYEGSTEEKAAIEISAAGFYRLFLNGRELTKGFFAPYISNPDHIIYYDEYDVTGLLKERNALCILLGNGFNNALDGGIWDFEKAPYRSAPKVQAFCRRQGNTDNGRKLRGVRFPDHLRRSPLRRTLRRAFDP